MKQKCGRCHTLYSSECPWCLQRTIGELTDKNEKLQNEVLKEKERISKMLKSHEYNLASWIQEKDSLYNYIHSPVNHRYENLIGLCDSFTGESFYFSLILRTGLEYLDIRNADLAHKFQVTPSSISNWTSHKCYPPANLQSLIVEFIKVEAMKASKGIGETDA